MLNRILVSRLTRVVFWVLLLGGCSQNDSKAQLNIELAKGSIRLINDGEYAVRHGKDSIVLKNVKTFIIFEGVPYFEVQGGKILRWITVLSDNGFNLQKVSDKLYYITETAAGVEVDKSYLNVIDSNGERKIELQYKGSSLSVEDYSILAGRVLVEKSYYEFCVSDKSKKIIKCYQWPDVPRQ